MKSYPKIVIEAVSKCLTDKVPAYTHPTSQMPLGELTELPLGRVLGDVRRGGFAIGRLNMGRLRATATTVAGFKPGQKRPGAKLAARIAAGLESLCGEPMILGPGITIEELAVRYAGLPLGDAWALACLTETDRLGGVRKLGPTECPRCGKSFEPRLNLAARHCAVYRGEDGALLPADVTPAAVVPLRRPFPLGIAGRDAPSSALVMTPPSWLNTLYQSPQAEFDEEEQVTQRVRVLAAALVGDEHGPFPGPVTMPRLDGMHPSDLDEVSEALNRLIGGPEHNCRFVCPNTAGGCAQEMAFPASWGNADFLA